MCTYAILVIHNGIRIPQHISDAQCIAVGTAFLKTFSFWIQYGTMLMRQILLWLIIMRIAKCLVISNPPFHRLEFRIAIWRNIPWSTIMVWGMTEWLRKHVCDIFMWSSGLFSSVGSYRGMPENIHFGLRIAFSVGGTVKRDSEAWLHTILLLVFCISQTYDGFSNNLSDVLAFGLDNPVVV